MTPPLIHRPQLMTAPLKKPCLNWHDVLNRLGAALPAFSLACVPPRHNSKNAGKAHAACQGLRAARSKEVKKERSVIEETVTSLLIQLVF